LHSSSVSPDRPVTLLLSLLAGQSSLNVSPSEIVPQTPTAYMVKKPL